MRPSRKNISSSIILTALTILTGALLVVAKPSSLGSACISGTLFIGLIALELTGAYKRLEKILAEKKEVIV